MKPILKYSGGKSRELDKILTYIPKYNGRYIEPFIGGGALFFHLNKKGCIINDLNKRLMDFYNGIADNYDALKQDIDTLAGQYNTNSKFFQKLKEKVGYDNTTDPNSDFYYQLRDCYNGKCNQFSEAFLAEAIYYIINKTAYSGITRFNSKGEYNVPYGRYKSIPTDNITLEHSLLLRDTERYNTTYEDIFKMSNEDDFIFIDPPYDCEYSHYGNAEHFGGFGNERQEKLAEDFKKLEAKTLIIINKTPLTERLYEDYIIDEYNKRYSINIKNRFGHEAKHLVITNYKLDV